MLIRTVISSPNTVYTGRIKLNHADRVTNNLYLVQSPRKWVQVCLEVILARGNTVPEETPDVEVSKQIISSKAISERSKLKARAVSSQILKALREMSGWEHVSD